MAGVRQARGRDAGVAVDGSAAPTTLAVSCAPEIVGHSAAMSRLRNVVAAVAPRRCTVLIRGETGTGKELVARAIHAGSLCRNGPFVPVDCTALPETLIESQLFGHVKGAFTGAGSDALGFIRAAEGGTLFLDEVGELPATAQAKLLRCLQERVVTPVGSVRSVAVNVRIVAATHRDLSAMVNVGAFRQDLYYRLSIACVEAPALRDRVEDVLPVAAHFLHQIATAYEEPVKRLSAGAAEALQRYGWPGNVRQLSNVIEHAVVFSRGVVIEAGDLPREVHAEDSAQPEPGVGGITTLAAVERGLILRALEATRGNVSRAARLIGVDRHRFRRKMVRYRISPVFASIATDQQVAVGISR